MAAGQGTDVRDATVVLFTQTATERAHTRAHEQVSVCVCLLLRGYGECFKVLLDRMAQILTGKQVVLLVLLS